jgi:hypothetical protein
MTNQGCEDTIFVSVAAYRDPQLLPTIYDCLAKARYPDRLRFGICWQYDLADEGLAELPAPQFAVQYVHWKLSRGACWARAEIMKRYEGESWYLQLDSHHRFTEGWDAKLIEQASLTRSEKPVLSTYAAGFSPGQEEHPGEQVTVMEFDYFTNEGLPLFRPGVVTEPPAQPIRARYVSAHFLFAPGSFVNEVPYDPELYFLGEEITLAVRAFTHGYDLFHPSQHILWHEYTRAGRRRHWDDHTNEGGARIAWHKRDGQSLAKASRLLTEPWPGPDGVGTTRSVADYEAYAGISFRHRRLQDDTRLSKEPPNPVTDRHWSDRITNHKIQIQVERNQLPPAALGDPYFWYVGFHDNTGTEIYRRDAQAAEVGEALTADGDTVTLTREFSSERRPASWTVLPYSISQGWLERVSGPVGPEQEIFISVASYRDPDLVSTLSDCLAKADHPGSLHFVVCWQHGPEERLPDWICEPQFTVLDVDWRESHGGPWARAAIMQKWAGEDWYLQIDSHHRFAKGWDSILKRQAGLTGSTKPLLSAPAPPFTIGEEPSHAQPLRSEFIGFRDNGIPEIRTGFLPSDIDQRSPVRARSICGHFLFAPGSFARDVPYDPDMYFSWEETTMAVRAFTHGYDLFHPSTVVTWHEYSADYRTRHWDDHTGEQDDEPHWQDLYQRAVAKAAQFFAQPCVGLLGLGQMRTFRDYEAYAGVSFQHRRIQDYTRLNGEPPNPPAEHDWPQRIRDHRFEIPVDISQLPAAATDDPDLWYVGIHDRDGHELYRQDADEKELSAVLPVSDGQVTLVRTFASEGLPASWTVLPRSASAGWLKPIRGAISASVAQAAWPPLAGFAMTGAPRNQVEVVIINWKRPRNVDIIVDALRDQTIPCTITICDCHQSPEFELKHDTLSSADRVYRWPHNLGSFSRYVPVGGYDHRYTMFIDDDMMPGRRCIEHFLTAADGRQSFGALGQMGRILDANGAYRPRDIPRGHGFTEVDILIRAYFTETRCLSHVPQMRTLLGDYDDPEDDILLSVGLSLYAGRGCYLTPIDPDPETLVNMRELETPHARSCRPYHYEGRSRLLRSAIALGWQPLQSRAPVNEVKISGEGSDADGRGVLYLAIGASYHHLTLASIASLRRYGYLGPVRVVTDDPTWVTPRLNCDIVVVPDAGDGWAARCYKTQLPKFGYDQTLFLDSDAIPIADISGIWEILDGHDIAMAPDLHPSVGDLITKNRNVAELRDEFSLMIRLGLTSHAYLNSGVMLFRRSLATATLFSSWHQEWQRFQKKDQMALVRAIVSTGTRVGTLPINWNCLARTFSSIRDAQRADVKVLHFLSHNRNLMTIRLAFALADGDRYPAGGDWERWNLNGTKPLPRGAICSSASSRLSGRGGGFLVRTTANSAEHLEMTLPNPRGGVESYWRKNDADDDSWSAPVTLGCEWGAAHSATLVQTHVAGQQNLELVMRCGSKLAHYSRQPSPNLPWDGPTWLADGVGGNPSLIQGSEGRNRNLELVVPLASGGIAHYWRDNHGADRPWKGPQIFALELGHVDALTLIESSHLAEGGLEVIARKGGDLAHYWRPLQDPGHWEGPTLVFTGATGIPSLIQSRDDAPGSFEVLTPLEVGGMAHLWRDNREAAGTWQVSTHIDRGGPRVDAVSLIHGHSMSHPDADLEAVALSGTDVRWYRRESGPFSKWSCRLL